LELRHKIAPVVPQRWALVQFMSH